MIAEAKPRDIDEIHRIFKLVDKNAWGRQTLEDAFENENCFFLVLKQENKTLGFAAVMLALDEAELLYIAVDPHFYGRGFGKSLLAAVLGRAKEKGASSMYLEVRLSNHAAVSLYENFGFKKSASRRGYYQNPSEDALVMVLTSF